MELGIEDMVICGFHRQFTLNWLFIFSSHTCKKMGQSSKGKAANGFCNSSMPLAIYTTKELPIGTWSWRMFFYSMVESSKLLIMVSANRLELVRQRKMNSFPFFRVMIWLLHFGWLNFLDFLFNCVLTFQRQQVLFGARNSSWHQLWPFQGRHLVGFSFAPNSD